MSVLRGDVEAELIRADEKFGNSEWVSDELWTVVLAEEVGEVARAVQENDQAALRAEIAQVIAVGLRWLRVLDGKELSEISQVGPNPVRYSHTWRGATDCRGGAWCPCTRSRSGSTLMSGPR